MIGGLSAYEEERRRRIQTNTAELARLEIRQLSGELSRDQRQRRAQRPAHRHVREDAGPRRRSDRLAGLPAMSFKESDLVEPDARALFARGRSSSSSSSHKRSRSEGARHPGPVGHASSREHYTREQLESLGTCASKYPWQEMLPKVYDQSGTSCHQCRQKTRDRKTECSQCHSIRGQFCGMCLQLRYGENLQEVLDTIDGGGEWVCPVCRGFCNCSICRCRRGWPPTGILAPYISDKYESVAHYLVKTHLEDADAASESECGSEAEEDQEESEIEDASDPASQSIVDDSSRASLTVSSGGSDEENQRPSPPQQQKQQPAPPRKKKTPRQPQRKRRAPIVDDDDFDDEEDEDEEEEAVYEVESIQGTMTIGGRRYFLVHWRGYSAAEDTWEPEENCSGCAEIVTAFMQESQQVSVGTNTQ